MITRKTIFDIIREADDDQNQAEPTNDNNTEDSGNNTDTNQNSTDNNEDNAADDDGEDIDLTTDLDTDGGDDLDGEEDGGGTDSGSSPDPSTDDETEKAVPANTDIFSSLSPEEQQIKIMELKKLYNNLYSSLNDIIDAFSNIKVEEDKKPVTDRISVVLYDIREYLSDYICNIFYLKSYIENDINFNRFLSIVNSVQVILSEIITKD